MGMSLKCWLSYSVSVDFRWRWWFFPWHGFWFSAITGSSGQCGHLYLSSNAENGVAKLNEVPTEKTLWPLIGFFPHWRCSCIWYRWDGFKTGSLRSSRTRLEIIQLYSFTCNSWHYLANRLFMCSWVPFRRLFLWFFPWFGKCLLFSLVGNQACFVLWQLLLAAPTFEALVRILPGRNQKYQCWMILAPQMETNCVCFGHGPQALLLALRNAMKQGFLMLRALLPTEPCMLRNPIGYFASCHLQMGI